MFISWRHSLAGRVVIGDARAGVHCMLAASRVTPQPDRARDQKREVPAGGHVDSRLT